MVSRVEVSAGNSWVKLVDELHKNLHSFVISLLLELVWITAFVYNGWHWDCSVLHTPYTSFFKCLLANFPLFVDHSISPSKPDLFPALSEHTTEEWTVMKSREAFSITSWQCFIQQVEGHSMVRIAVVPLLGSGVETLRAYSHRINCWRKIEGHFNRQEWKKWLLSWNTEEADLSSVVLSLLCVT